MAEAAWINADAGAPEYNALELRRLDSVLVYPASNVLGARSGVRPQQLTQTLVSLAGTTWTVQNHSGVLYPALTTTSGPYRYFIEQTSAALNAADGSNPRIDALDLQIRDDDEDASGFRDVQIVYVPGTPAGSPSAPALTATSMRLATILVPAGGSPAPSVTSQAPFTVASGGILPVRDSSELPATGRYEGMAVFQQDTNALRIWDGSTWTAAGNTSGYQFRERVLFTSSGTFDKADYPGIRAVLVRCQGGGGGGGGATTTSTTQASSGSGGNGGDYAESWLLESALSASETVTVGSGGSGGTTADGATGGSSSFGSHVVASGGTGGNTASASTGYGGDDPQLANASSTGDVVVKGNPAGYPSFHSQTEGFALSSSGGNSFLGGGGRGRRSSSSALSGGTGQLYGGGGGGAANGNSTGGADAAQAGGTGAAGIVVVDVFV